MASGKIRGITIELSGDTKGLVKSLNGAKSAVRGVQTQLKDVNKVLKLDPKNTDLLKQKQELLKTQVEKTKDALEQQKQALADLQNSADSDKTIDAQNALQREIAETEEKLKSAEQELKAFGSVGAQQFSAVGEQVQAMGKNVASVGDELTKKVTAPIVALGGLSIKAFKDVDAGMDIIVEKTGATGENLKGMQDSFKNIAKSVPSDFETIGSAIGEVNTRFGVTGDELETLSTQFIQFSSLNSQDVSTAVDQTQKALSAFGLSSASAGEYLDVMNTVAQSTGVSVDKLQAGIVQNGTAFQELGLNIEQSTLFMGQLEKSGANSETVLNGLRKALKNATAEGKPLDQALSELEDTITNGTDGMDGLTASYELFGKSGDQIYGAVKNGTISFKDLAKASLEAGGSVEDTFTQTLDPLDQFQVSMQSLKITGAEVGNTLFRVLAPAFDKIATAVEKLGTWWDSLSPKMQDIIVKVGLIIAVIGPLLATGGRLMIGIGQLMTFAPAIVSGVTAIGAVLTGTVIPAIVGVVTALGPIILAIGAVIAIGVLLYKHWDEISAKAIEIWEAIKEFFSKTLEAIKQKFLTIWTNIKTTITNVINQIKTTVTNIWNAIKTTISNVVNGIRDKVSTTWNSIKEKISNTVQNIKDKVSNVFSSLRDRVSNLFNSIKEKMTAPIEKAKSIIDGVVQKIKGIFPLSIGRIFSNLKLPHISVSAGSPPFGIGGKGTKPSFSVDWYAKAMKNGILLNKPTIFGVNYNGQPMGGGEAGDEWIVGHNSLMSHIQRAVQNGFSTSAIYDAVYSGASNARVEVYIDGQKVTSIVNGHNTSGQLNKLRERGI